MNSELPLSRSRPTHLRSLEGRMEKLSSRHTVDLRGGWYDPTSSEANVGPGQLRIIDSIQLTGSETEPVRGADAPMASEMC